MAETVSSSAPMSGVPSIVARTVLVIDDARLTPLRSTSIDWGHLISRRPAVLKHAEALPAHLLLPEVRGFLGAIHHAQSRLLFSTLWARVVRTRDARYLDMLQTYFGSARLEPDERLFPITRQAVDARLRSLIKTFKAAGGELSIPVSCDTFRHSFAVNCILHRTPLPVLQGWLWHAHIESTVVYTQVLLAETGHWMAEIEF